MIPAFPMDGGRVLRALLAIRLGHMRATEIAASIGQVVAFGLGFLGLFGNPLLIFIAIFVYLAASSEAQLVAMRAMSRDVPVEAAMMTQFARLAPEAHIDEAVDTLMRTSQSEFPVVDADGRLVGLLSRADMIRALKELGPDAKVADAMTREIPTIGHRACLEEAVRLLQEKQAPAIGVPDAAGKLVGLITSETIGEMLMVRDALPQGDARRPLEPAGRREGEPRSQSVFHCHGTSSTDGRRKAVSIATFTLSIPNSEAAMLSASPDHAAAACLRRLRPPRHRLGGSRGRRSAAPPTGRASPMACSRATSASSGVVWARADRPARMLLRCRDHRQLQELDPLGVARRAARNRFHREGADRQPAVGPGHLLPRPERRTCPTPIGRRRAGDRPFPHRAGRPALDLVRVVGRHRRPGLGHRRVARRHDASTGPCGSIGRTSSSIRGDTIYADGPIEAEMKLPDGSIWKNLVAEEKSKVAETLAEFRGNYKYNLLDRNLRAFNAEVPIFTQWDDHEVTNNWSPSRSLTEDKRYSEKSVPLLAARAARAFHEFMPIAPRRRRPARVYRKVAYGPLLDIFFLDMRTYRGPNTDNRQSESGPETVFLGRDAARLAEARACGLARDLEGDRGRHAARHHRLRQFRRARRARRRSRKATGRRSGANWSSPTSSPSSSAPASATRSG